MITITGIDIETTGFNAEDGHRITEIAMVIQRYDPEARAFSPVGQFSRLVNPKRMIPDNIQKLTHITPELVRDCPAWEEVAPTVGRIIRATDLFMAHNAEFDSTFLGYELLRVGERLSPHTQVFCTMENGRFATPMGKPPKLIELCRSLGVEFDPDAAHRAIYDTERMMAALNVGVAKGYFNLDEVVKLIKQYKRGL